LGGSYYKNEYERIPRKVLSGKCYNTKPVGKPRIRWKDVDRIDTSQILGLIEWRK